MRNDSIPWEMLNRHGRRSAIAIERKRPYLDRVARMKAHQYREGLKRAAGLKARIEKIKQRKAAARAFMSTLKPMKS